MVTKSFRFDWYPKDAHTDFMQLSPEEIGVLMQICNLIYMHHGPIPNDGKWIARNMNDFGTAKCNRVIKQLIAKGHLDLTDEEMLSKKMCERQIEIVDERRDFYSASRKKKSSKNRKSNLKTDKKAGKNNTSFVAKQSDGVSIEVEATAISRKASLVIEEMPQLNLGLLDDFFLHRKSLGKPVHENFVPNVIEDLKQLTNNGEDPNLVLEQSIKNGWSSLRPIQTLKGNQNDKRKTRKQDLGEQAARLLEQYSSTGSH